MDYEHCNGEVLDMEDACFVTDTQVSVATFKEAANADIIFVTAGIHLKPGEKREHLLSRNALLLKDVRGVVGLNTINCRVDHHFA